VFVLTAFAVMLVLSTRRSDAVFWTLPREGVFLDRLLKASFQRPGPAGDESFPEERALRRGRGLRR